MQIETIFTVAGLTMLALLPMVNPPTSATLLLGLSKGHGKSYLSRQAKLASLFLFIALTVTFFIGSSILELFSISMPSLRLGGGLIIGAIGFKMLFPAPPEKIELPKQDSIAFVPLTIPSMCGPGTMALVISGASEIASLPEDVSKPSVYLGSLIGFAGVALVAWLVLSMAYPTLKLLGKNGIDAFTRIMGFLLVCMGAQFLVNGLTEVYQTMVLVV
ncbi:MarC family NAAT transporter [Agarivorans sp. Alg241-V36]|uniref:MarC family NAAT transporter n=1 Tax=Agarivorans sp. Alg241-V36 TaxID=2305992 RepID=UPI0013D45B50|nr:MarC family NAAT transporter [Agarivorans sp. Alg241-V36]